ncbi:hypothetical protein OIU91_06045 [Streptomyces sp. NBC_01456]|uniref:hypothetical protein n=1 Tax=unclassified Streptomyces TaxID=2593676 RepID=UPI002E2ED32B|nr:MULTISPECIES: hypothetical protein [unclassified Streptomyces]
MSTHLSTREHREETTMATVAEDTRPTLSLVKPESIEGAVVEHQGETLRPAWSDSGKELAARAREHAAENQLYIGWTVRGYRNLTRRWLEARRDDYPQLIQSAIAERKASAGNTAAETAAKELVKERRAEYRVHKRWHWIKTGGWSAAGTTGITTAVVVGGGWVDVLLALGAYAVGTWHGRPGAGQSAFTDATSGLIAIEPGENDPFPIADANTRDEAAECVRRALVSEGINVAAVEAGRRYPWGWEITVRLKKGTPADLIAKAPELETPLDLPTDGLLCQPMRQKRAQVVLRLVEGDPFEDMPALPVRKPNSIAMRDKALVAKRMDGQHTMLSFLGQHFIVIASSGGGKSVTFRTIGDTLTDCEDVIVVDLDPGGNGLEPLAAAVGVRVVGADQMHIIEAVLEKLLKIAKARAMLLGKLGMGDNWIPSPRYPAIVTLIDEYPQLSQRAKALVVAILRVGRKSRVQIGLAAQEATKDSIGAAIADSIALKIVGPSRHQDIVQVFGAGAGANGWRSDRLHPAQGEDPADAGKAYIMGGGSTDPLIHKFIPMTYEEGKRRAAERAAAGRPWFDPESLDLAGVTFDDLDTVQPHEQLPEAIELARAAFTAADDPARMTAADLYEYVAAAAPESWAPEEDEEIDIARDRYLKALRDAATEVAPAVDMKTKQWRGGRGFYLATLIELTGEEAPEGT